MFTPWLTLRQANEALAAGRPDDALRLIQPLIADGHRKAMRLAGQIATTFVAAGEKALRNDDPETAWANLLAAEQASARDPRTTALRQQLLRLALAECRAALEAGHPQHAIHTITRLRERQAFHPDFDSLAAAAEDWLHAQELADRGDFLLASNTAERIRPRLGTIPATGLERFLTSLNNRHDIYRTAVAALAENPRAADWAAKVVSVAPAHREARNMQVRAWEQQPTLPYVPEADLVPLVAKQSKRFLLWIDGVGGYLVCLGPRTTFGQASADAPIDVPLLADLSRLHAEISRDGEGYVLESSRGALVNSAPITRTTLKPGDRVTLGNTCQFLFHQPLAISPTARLELVSGHRLHLAVDGVLLMADTLLIGPAGQGHVIVPWLVEPIVLYRSKDGLGVRITGEFQVDAKRELNRAILPLPAVITSPHLNFAIEPLTPRQ